MKKLFASALILSVVMSCKQEASQTPEAPATETVESPAKSSTTMAEVKKPTQHLKVADLTSLDNAVKVFNETVVKLKAKTKFDAAELNEIHLITYSTEKALAYFGENFTGEQKELAKKAVIVLEEVHLASESNNKDATQKKLTEFLALAVQIAMKLK
ncbi:hypothetical protein LNTAR_08231 [Lentisphaera araneosa HTCC2155]|jgi:hypothetical protein|uniref:Uncharacterized protein n=1 Tax=Lentisphaera araneosa HTCC2155 TaxID=313628 RepID=A6DS20_9BACT|nr:DUF6746 family protein [Lentisphaera araneosa]EDM25595.1 hypothetical protein LNTAR_08231 [Lentisphaera araneosa HTCC2155]